MWRLVEILMSLAIGVVAVVELTQGVLHGRRRVPRKAAGHLLAGIGCSWWVIDVARGRGIGWPGVWVDLLSYVLVFMGIWLVGVGKPRQAGSAAQ